jgi:predicted PurR-regulated permease PerM
MGEEKRVERVIAGLGLSLVAIGCLVVLWPFATPLLWACTLAFSTWPLFTRLERSLGGRRAAAAGVMTLGAAVILVAPLVLLVTTLAENVGALVALLRHWLEVGPPGPPDWVSALPLAGPRLAQRWAKIANDGAAFTAALTPYLATIRDFLLSAGGSLSGGLGRLLLSLVLAFFIYCNGGAIAARLHVGMRRIGGVRGPGLEILVADTVRGVVYGVLGTNLIQAALATIGFLLAGIPGAVVLGMLCFFLTLVPLGTGLIWLPAVIWVASQGRIGTALLLAVWSVLIFVILENVLRAWLVGRRSALPMILLLLGMVGGLLVFGLLGLLIGPALLAIGHALVSEWTGSAAAEPQLNDAPAGAAPPARRAS